MGLWKVLVWGGEGLVKDSSSSDTCFGFAIVDLGVHLRGKSCVSELRGTSVNEVIMYDSISSVAVFAQIVCTQFSAANVENFIVSERAIILSGL